MPRLKFLGDYYRGDGITARRGDTVEVSEEKASQLLKDFPGDWKPGRTPRSAPGKGFNSPQNKKQEPAKNKGTASE